MAYQGHKNRNAWNVALWIANDEPLYRLALRCKRSTRNAGDAAAAFLRELRDGADTKTPDGAPFRFSYVRSAISGLE
jgi:hypothetical protein